MSDAGTTTPPPANGAVPWHQAADFGEGMAEYVANKGWTAFEPSAGLREVTRAYRDLEKFRGIPAEEIARIPKNPDDPAMAALLERLGTPKEPAGYTFDGVVRPDGTAPDPEYLDAVRAAAVKARVPAGMAKTMAAEMLVYEQAKAAKATEAQAIKVAADKAALDREWGPKKDENLFHISKLVERLGMSPETLAVLEGQAGTVKVMNDLLKFARAMGEPDMLRGPGTAGSTNRMTPDEAQAAITARMGDAAWYAKWRAGDAAAIEEWKNLNALSRVPH